VVHQFRFDFSDYFPGTDGRDYDLGKSPVSLGSSAFSQILRQVGIIFLHDDQQSGYFAIIDNSGPSAKELFPAPDA